MSLVNQADSEVFDIHSKLSVDSHTFGIDFHPSTERLHFLTCHVSSDVFLWSQEHCNGPFIKQLSLKHHTQSCRVAKFLSDGECFVTGSSDKTCQVVDMRGAQVWCSKPKVCHTDAVNAICPLYGSLFLSGDDSGNVILWDIRTTSPCFSLSINQDVIFSITTDSIFHPEEFLVTCGDKLGKGILKYPKIRLKAISDAQEADLLCCCSVRTGSKILCGTTNNGAISIFDWTNLEDTNDRIVNHGVSVDHIIPLQSLVDGEDILVTGSGDGFIRLLSLFPNDILACIGPHNASEDIVEALAVSPDNRFVVSSGHDNLLAFHQLPTAKEIEELLARDPQERRLTKPYAQQQFNFFSDL